MMTNHDVPPARNAGTAAGGVKIVKLAQNTRKMRALSDTDGSVTNPSPAAVTQLLRAWSDGDEQALERLLPLVEVELRRLARGYMARERGGHSPANCARERSVPPPD